MRAAPKLRGPCFCSSMAVSPKIAAMDYRTLGRSGLDVAPVGLGTMMFGDRTDAATGWRLLTPPQQAPPAPPTPERAAATGDLARGGKTRSSGLPTSRGWRIAEVMRWCEKLPVPKPVVCQPYYNLLNRTPEIEVLP